jgi:ADP-ribose pyrophosphatase
MLRAGGGRSPGAFVVLFALRDAYNGCMAGKLRVLERKLIYKGRLVDLSVDRIVEPGGLKATREVIRHPGSVVVIPYLPDGRLLLVRQFRYAVGKAMWELVAGGLEPNETPLEAAGRELIEETGYRAGSLRPLVSFYPSPGILGERMHLFEATHLARAARNLDEDERIQVRRFSPAQVTTMLESRKLEDGKTLLGLLWVLREKGTRR